MNYYSLLIKCLDWMNIFKGSIWLNFKKVKKIIEETSLVDEPKNIERFNSLKKFSSNTNNYTELLQYLSKDLDYFTTEIALKVVKKNKNQQ